MNETKEGSVARQPVEKKKGAPAESVGEVQSQASVLTGAGNIEKIRDILFGSQMREYEKRFVRLEDRMQKEVQNLKEDVRARFESLENYMKREFELLAERQKTEKSDRITAVNEVSEELKAASSSIDKKISQLEDQLDKRYRDLHDQILVQSKNLSEEIRQKHEAVSGVLEQEAKELQVDKVDRANLSELFMEMAMRLSNKGDVNFDLATNELLNE